MSQATASPVQGFSLAQARRIVGDLFEPNPRIYWADFLASIFGGHACYVTTRYMMFGLNDLARPPESLALRWSVGTLTFLVGGLLFYRSAMFIHELVHLRTGTFRGFRFAWNLLCGLPFFIPSYVYYPHLDHHRRKHYGTELDGEYLPLARRGVGYLLLYLAQIAAIPPVVFFRFLVLTPLGWILPPVRRFAYRHCSSMVMDPLYVRPAPAKNTVWVIYLQEAVQFLLALGIVVVPLVWRGKPPIEFAVQGYLTGLYVIGINHIRTLGAHRWRNDGRSEMTFVGQLVDSLNYPRPTLAARLWGPIGLRYHALHHLFPSMPYHNLAEAHRRLMDQLPADSPYRKTIQPSLSSSLAELWGHVRHGGQSVAPLEA